MAVIKFVPGGDVSKWQQEIDWSVFGDKKKFVFIRAGSVSTTGELYEDYQFQRNAEEAHKYLAVGFYWYWRPTSSSVDQARYFYNLMKGKTSHLPPVIDCEEYKNSTNSQRIAGIKSFLDELERLTGEKAIIYTSPSYWNHRIGETNWARDYELWIAHWNADEPIIPADWKNHGLTYTFWQTHVGSDGRDFGCGAPGLDHDLYNGNWVEFKKKYFGIEPPSEYEPPDNIYLSGDLQIRFEGYTFTGHLENLELTKIE